MREFWPTVQREGKSALKRKYPELGTGLSTELLISFGYLEDEIKDTMMQATGQSLFMTNWKLSIQLKLSYCCLYGFSLIKLVESWFVGTRVRHGSTLSDCLWICVGSLLRTLKACTY